MDKRNRRDLSRSYNKDAAAGDSFSHDMRHGSENADARRRSDSRPPGNYAAHARVPGSVAKPPRRQSPPPPEKGGFSYAGNKDMGADSAITLTRRKRWDSPQADTVRATRSRPAATAETKALRIVDTQSGPGPRIRFGKFKAKGGHTAAKAEKGATKFRRTSIARTASMLSMAAATSRQSREDSSVQDSGAQSARLARNTTGAAAQNARRMVRQIRARQYANAAKKSAKGASSAARGVKGVMQKIGYLFQSIAATGNIGLAATVVIAAVIVLILVTAITFSIFMMVFNGGAAAVNGSAMTANDADIDRAEAYYSGKEAALQTQIENAEQSHPGYNEYQYQIGGVGHNPVALAAYLSAMYGDFTFDGVKSKLDTLFAEQYKLTFPTRSETRMRPVQTTDPDTGQVTTTQEPYTYTIMTVSLVSQDFTALVTPLLQQAGVLDVYSVYLQNHGNRMYFANPFPFGWSVYATLASDNSVSIDVPAGTEIKSSLAGKVTQAAGGTVVVTGSDGLSVTYRSCTGVRVSAGQSVNAGDVIAQTGAGFSILFVRNGEHLNPFIFADTGDTVDTDTASIVIGGNPIGGSVEAYRTTVTQLAAQYGMGDYVNLILAVMEQESGGRGTDPMQAAEGSFNTRYPQKPNGITDPVYSIQCGIQELQQNLRLAGVTGPNDATGIALALQGYNFGSGFISWAKSRGGYTLSNAQAYSQIEAASLGWSSYGDPYYVPHVLRYYQQ